MVSKRDKGLTIIYTGDGKGKTTASLGLAVRAIGRGKKVSIVQFIKGSWTYGEQEGIKRLAPEAEMVWGGKGFVGIIDDKLPREEHVKAAQDTLALAKKKLTGGKHDIVILDEVNVALQLELLTVEEVLEVLKSRPETLDVVCTGRGAPQELIDYADLVTEMQEIKHPFQQKIPAKKGIDF